VFTIHDLQHKHLPELFTASHLALRELLYPPAFAESRAIVAIANWVKQDVVEHYKISEKKIFVIPSAPGLGCNSEVSALLCAEVRQRYGLPQEFALYPALTYQHKNHIRLLDAVSVIERSGSKAIPIVCTGARKLFWNTIEDRRRQLGLEKAVRFTDFVPPEHLVALLRMAKFVVLPTLFEGVGLPLLEAFQNEVPVACSDIPAFREYGGTVPLYFNPRSAEEIAAALVRMNVDGVLRERIRSEGSQRARLYSWKESALKYWVVYRWAAGVQLSAEEQTILASMRGECLNGHRRASDVIV
jgi:glycosyltransferase involved in cell wall biosynthesis